MKCPFCKAPTRVTHTYVCGIMKTTERQCTGPKKHKLTFVTVFVQEAQKRGEGAAALARKIEEGKIVVHVEAEEEADES